MPKQSDFNVWVSDEGQGFGVAPNLVQTTFDVLNAEIWTTDRGAQKGEALSAKVKHVGLERNRTSGVTKKLGLRKVDTEVHKRKFLLKDLPSPTDFVQRTDDGAIVKIPDRQRVR